MAILLEVEPTQGVTSMADPDQDNFATLEKTTTRQTARNAGDYEDAASDFLEKTYADRSGASSGLSTTYGILSFVGFLAVCRTVDFINPDRHFDDQNARQNLGASRCSCHYGQSAELPSQGAFVGLWGFWSVRGSDLVG